MSKLRVLGSMMLALSLTAGAAGVASATDLVVGHGIPGVKVDVCAATGGALLELKSDFTYGKTFKLQGLPAGRYFITVRAAKGVCQGKKLIKIGPVTFNGDEDLTVVATKTGGTPTVVLFDNSAGYDSDPGPVLSVKHAAMLGAADVYVDELVQLAAAEPTLAGVPKGAQADIVGWSDGSNVKVGVAKAGSGKIAKQTPYWELKAGKINHVIPVGPPDKLRFLRFRTENKEAGDL